MKRIEDFYVGQTAKFNQTITTEMVRKFVDLTGDDNPLHVNQEFAEKSSFKGIVTHGMLSASFISTMVGKHIPGDGALWVSQNLQFLLPVRLNDTLTITAEITKIVAKERLLTLHTEILNQYGQKVLVGEGQVFLLEVKEESETSSVSKTGRTPVVLVTGASRGIGAATAKLFASKGSIVVINYREDIRGAERTQQEIINTGGLAILAKGDVSKEKDVDNIFSMIKREYGYLSVLVNNASPKIIEKKISDSNWEDYNYQIEGQLKSAFLCSNAALNLMIENKEGVIITIGSTVAIGVPPIKWSAYNIVKSALLDFTKCLAVEVGSLGIRANMVSPGMTDTRMISEIPEKQRLLQAAQTPMRRLSTVEDVAKAICFLASEEANFITGENLIVSGGKTMH